VPRISEFYGIVIAMYPEHGVAHFHGTYAGETAVISIQTGGVIAGGVPARALRLIQEWCELHRDELRLNWARARDNAPLVRIVRFRSILSMDLAAHLHRIVELEVLGEHRLRLAFEDGLSGELDASNWDWSGVFEPLRDPTYFARVELDQELGTISWPNGADVVPETLHLWIASGRENVSA
jgi:hypothetical protein